MKPACLNRLLPMAALFLAAFTPAHAQTKTFKCLIGGRTVYQQTACPVTQSNDATPAAEAASAASASASRAPTKSRAVTPSASAASHSQGDTTTTHAEAHP